jgi:hypothetical protein
MMMQLAGSEKELSQSKIDNKFSDFDPKFVAYLE